MRTTTGASRNSVNVREPNPLRCGHSHLHAARRIHVLGRWGCRRARGAFKTRTPFHTGPPILRNIKTLPQAALIYHLSGDYNPFHPNPDLAKEVGFEKPIVHGRCTFGIAARAITDDIGRASGTTIHAMDARLTAPVFPGETIQTETWGRR
jgi:hypothetical protein